MEFSLRLMLHHFFINLNFVIDFADIIFKVYIYFMMQVLKDASPFNRFFFPVKPPGYGYEGDSTIEKLVFLGGKGDPCLVESFGFHQNQPNRCVIYFHGNYMDLGEMQYTEMPLLCTRLQATLIVPEYPGYGLALGSASEGECKRVASQVINYAVNSLGFRHKDIILMGRSIGTGVALYACEHLVKSAGPPFAVILQSAFTSLRDVARELTSLGVLLSSRFPNKTMIDSLNISNLLLIHGKEDSLINPSHSCQLHEAAKSVPNKKLLIYDKATHNSFPNIIPDIVSFVENCSSPSLCIDSPMSSASWLSAFGKSFTACIPSSSTSIGALISSSPSYPCDEEVISDKVERQPFSSSSTPFVDRNTRTTHQEAPDKKISQASRDKNSLNPSCSRSQVQHDSSAQHHNHVQIRKLTPEDIQSRFERQQRRVREHEASIHRWMRVLGVFMSSSSS
eukprot:gene3565-8319_t